MRINEIAMYLGLEKPYDVKIRSHSKAGFAGAYWSKVTKNNKLHSHLIHIYVNNLDSPRGIEVLLAHEMIHAWQAENKKLIKNKKKDHGEEFVKMAKKLGRAFELEGIYNKELDIT